MKRPILFALLILLPVGGNAAPPPRPAGSFEALIGNPTDNTNLATALNARQPVFRPESYGASGDGNHDDTTAVQSAITAAVAVNGIVKLSSSIYKITSALTISDAITIEGVHVAALYGATESSDPLGGEIPSVSPYLTGSIILQTTAATNAINITAIGRSTNLKSFGIKFSDAIKFKNTGHGVYCVPPIAGTRETGIFDAEWDNVMVYGGDGNHYGFYIVNAINLQADHLRSFGGGGIYFAADGAEFAGNSLFNCPYVATFVGGTADGFHLDKTNGGTNNFTQFHLPQCNMHAGYLHALDAGITDPSGSQYTFYVASGVGPTHVYGAIMEGTVPTESAGVSFTQDGNTMWISQDSQVGQSSSGLNIIAQTRVIGTLDSYGPLAQLRWFDRTNNAPWLIYSDSGSAHLFNGNGNLWTIANTGGLTLPSIAANTSALIGGAASFASAPFAVRVGTNLNLQVYNDGPGNAVGLGALNDANNAYSVMNFSASAFNFNVGSASFPNGLTSPYVNVPTATVSTLAGFDGSKNLITFAGTIPTARLGSGTASSTTFLAGDQTYKTISTGLTIGSTAIASGAGSTNLLYDNSGTLAEASLATLGIAPLASPIFTGVVTIPTHTPSSASDTGTAGTIAWDANYIYVCVSSNSWKRVAISSW